MARGIAAGDRRPGQAGTPHDRPQDPPESRPEPLARRDRVEPGHPHRLALGGDRRVVGAGGTVDQGIATGTEGGAGLRDGAADLPLPGLVVDEPPGIEPDAGEAVIEGVGDLACRRGRDRARHDGDPRDRPAPGRRRLGGQQAGRAPIGDERGLDPLRADGEDGRPAPLPDQPAGLGQGLGIEHVEGDDRRPFGPRPIERRIALSPLHRHEIDEADRKVGLAGEVAGEIGLVHRRRRVACHGRVAVEAVTPAVGHREQVAEALVAAHPRIGDDHWGPAAGDDPAADLDGAADRAEMRRRIEGRADLVVGDRRLQAREEPEGSGQFRSIQAGGCERATPAMPTARAPGKAARRSGAGVERNRTVSSPAKASTSIAADEPVKSSP